MQRKHLLFASYEIHPITAGGCGVFIWHAINELLSTTDYKITLLLDIPKFECEKFINEHAKNIPNNERLQVVCLSDRIPWEYLPLETFNNVFMFKSYMFYRVIESMVEIEQIDYVEFFDYVGIGYFSVNAKKYEGKFQNTILGIRGHCTVDLMDLEQCQGDFSKEKIQMYKMEKIALQNADIVLVQTESWKPLYVTRYGVNPKKVLISEPPMDNSDFPKYEPHANKNVLFYGRVFQLKGVDDYINAGIQYLIKHKNVSTKFYIVGYDSKTKEGESYTEYLKAQIPDDMKEQFVFTGKLTRQQFKQVLDDISIAVFPNYVESFCYSIHELYEAGVPIICRRIPAFEVYFENKNNCIMFDNGVHSIIECIEKALAKNITKIYSPEPILTKGIDKVYKDILEKNRIDIKIENNNVEYDGKLKIISIENQKTDNNWIDKFNPIRLKTTQETGMIPINFLGKRYWISEEDLSKKLEKNILILEESVQINEESIMKGIEILQNSSISYVCFLEHKKGQIHYNALELDTEYNKEIFSYIPLIIFKNNKKNIIDLFDFRYGRLGILEILNKQGYTILQNYILRDQEINNIADISNEEILFEYRKSLTKEWFPEILTKFLYKKEIENKNSISQFAVDKKNRNKYARKIYFKLKAFLYKSKLKKTNLILNKLEKIKEIYKKFNN